MKKGYSLIIVLLGLFLIGINNHSIAQCSLSDPAVRYRSITENTAGGNSTCEIIADLSFQIVANNGNKETWVGIYPDNTSSGYFSRSGADTNKFPSLNQMQNVRAVFGINSETASLVTSYKADTKVDTSALFITTADGVTLIREPVVDANGATIAFRYTLKNLKIVAPRACTEVANFKMETWSTQAEKGTVAHCIFTGARFVGNDPVVGGVITCSRDVLGTVTQTLSFKVTTLSTNPISGTYDLYVDTDDSASQVLNVQQDATLVTNQSFNTNLVNGAQEVVIIYTRTLTNPAQLTTPIWINLRVIDAGGAITNTVQTLIVNNCGAGGFNLPVSMKRFMVVENVNRNPKLIWETTQELNNKGFEVQRQLNGGSFERIGYVNARKVEETAYNTYQFEDNNLPIGYQGMVNYRLKQEDHDGKYSVTNTVVFRKGLASDKIMLFPNPAKGRATLMMPANFGDFDVEVVDISGKLQKRQSVKANNQTQIEGIAPGLYLVRVKRVADGAVSTHRLMIQ